jgi:monofunctional chorismate mutase
MKLDMLRQSIDQIDLKMMHLFVERVRFVQDIKAYKEAHQLPILDQAREDQVLNQLKPEVPEALWPYYETFMKHVMNLSKDIQQACIDLD